MFYRVFKGVVGPFVRAYFRVRAEGVDRVPPSGAVVLAANHCSFFDSFVVPLVVPRRVTYVAKAEYFEKAGTAWFFKSAGQIPIKRGGGSDSERALESALEVLGKGGVFGIYPEGTRSPDGRLYKGHTGVARVAFRSGAPVVPVGIVGSFEAAPKHKKMPKPGRITVRFGRPIDLSAYASSGDRLALRAATDEVMFEIKQLSAQIYVDRYAGSDETGAGDPVGVAHVGAVA